MQLQSLFRVSAALPLSRISTLCSNFRGLCEEFCFVKNLRRALESRLSLVETTFAAPRQHDEHVSTTLTQITARLRSTSTVSLHALTYMYVPKHCVLRTVRLVFYLVLVPAFAVFGSSRQGHTRQDIVIPLDSVQRDLFCANRYPLITLRQLSTIRYQLTLLASHCSPLAHMFMACRLLVQIQ